MIATMLVTRLAKAALIAALAAYALIVAYDNIVDYGSNYEFVEHVLSMDTTFAGNALRHRAISDESAWRTAYALIIATEWLTAVLLALGAIALLRRLTAPAEAFNRAKVWAVAGLTVGFGLWFFGFLVIAGEYFAMWQSQVWNGQEAAFRIVTVILGVLVFVSLPDGELARANNSQIGCGSRSTRNVAETAGAPERDCPGRKHYGDSQHRMSPITRPRRRE